MVQKFNKKNAMQTLSKTITICGCFASQPIGDFFVGVIPSTTLCAITFTDTRRIDERMIERHAGINRPVNPDRVREISQYVHMADATFPNSIIISIGSENIVEQSDRSLTININADVAKIIDGQHRISGLQAASPNNFDLVVSIFVDLPIEDQATIFSTINLKQARVDKSLVYDLFELSTRRSPQKTCHEIVRSLNFDKDSPFYKRIKLLGRNPTLEDGTVLYKAPLSQAAFVKHLLPMISDDPDKDRNLLKRGEAIYYPSDAVEKGLIFRKYFVDDEDSTIIRIINNYFNGVEQTFPEKWKNYDNPLSKTIGFGALMRLLKNYLYPLGKIEKTYKTNFFKTYLERIKVNLDFDSYSPSGSGETNLYKDLVSCVISEEDIKKIGKSYKDDNA